MKMVSEWRKHRDEPVASIGQGKNAELVEDLNDVGDGGEKPVEVVLVDALWVEGDDFQKPSGTRAECLEQRRGERELDRGSEARLMLGLQCARSASPPLSDKPSGVPPVLMRDSG